MGPTLFYFVVIVLFTLTDLFNESSIHRSDYSPHIVIANNDRFEMAGTWVDSQ